MMGEQMSERDELARVMHGPGHGGVCMLCTEHADAALAWFAEHRGPRVVSTAEELDALPPYSAVVARLRGERVQLVWQNDAWGDWRSMAGTYSASRLVADAVAPFAVLFTPTTEGEDR